MDQVQGQNTGVNQNVAELLTSEMREAWEKFMEEFNQVFEIAQLDPVLYLLKQLKSNSQNPEKRQRIHGTTDKKEEEDDSSSESDNDNNDSSSLEKKVFGNHLLAKSVFKYLSHTDLLSCRLINSYWKEFATEILLKENFSVKFIRRTNSIRYFLQYSEDNVSNWRTLDMLTELLRTCKRFPCNKFVFEGGNLGNDDAQRFFSVYGKFIKSIRIILEDRNLEEDVDKSEDGFSVSLTGSRTIGIMLNEQLPNLEALYLYLDFERGDSRDWDGYNSLLFSPEENTKLPHLKTLDYDAQPAGSDKSFLHQLLNAATNLKRFGNGAWGDGFDLRYSDVLIKTGKVKTISELALYDDEQLEEFEKLADHGPELDSLKPYLVCELHEQPQLWKRTSNLLSKLIESSQNSLIELGFPSLGFLPQLKLPVLKNVKHVKLQVIRESSFNPEDVHDYSYSFLPRGATFSRNFPQLNSLKIRFVFKISNNNNDDNAAWWTKYFPTDEIIPPVKKLEISFSNNCPDLWMKKFSSMFPNVKSLSAIGIEDFSFFSQSIWKYYPKLTELKLAIDLTSTLNSSSPHSLDSSFTGISLEECTRLEKLSFSALEQIGDNFMQNPSILNLKDLMNLDITFSVDLERYQALKPLSTFTLISGTCAFNPLKSLKLVNVRVHGLHQNKDVQLEIEESLKPLMPYKVIVEK